MGMRLIFAVDDIVTLTASDRSYIIDHVIKMEYIPETMDVIDISKILQPILNICNYVNLEITSFYMEKRIQGIPEMKQKIKHCLGWKPIGIGRPVEL